MQKKPTDSKPVATRKPAPAPLPAPTDLAFLPVHQLAELIRTRRISPVELTRLYLERCRSHDPKLHCIVTLTDKLALEQAEEAETEIMKGR